MIVMTLASGLAGVAGAAAIATGGGGLPAVAGTTQQQQSGSTARDRSDFTMLRDEGFPLNIDPEIIGADEAELAEGDMVMGVVINGEARAYPVNYMNGPTNEVVNDVLGGAAIAPSW